MLLVPIWSRQPASSWLGLRGSGRRRRLPRCAAPMAFIAMPASAADPRTQLLTCYCVNTKSAKHISALTYVCVVTKVSCCAGRRACQSKCRIITYTRAYEDDASPRAAGWVCEGPTGGDGCPGAPTPMALIAMPTSAAGLQTSLWVCHCVNTKSGIHIPMLA